MYSCSGCCRDKILLELLLRGAERCRVRGVDWPADVIRESLMELRRLLKVVMVSEDGEIRWKRAGMKGRQETRMPMLCSTALQSWISNFGRELANASDGDGRT